MLARAGRFLLLLAAGNRTPGGSASVITLAADVTSGIQKAGGSGFIKMAG